MPQEQRAVALAFMTKSLALCPKPLDLLFCKSLALAFNIMSLIASLKHGKLWAQISRYCKILQNMTDQFSKVMWSLQSALAECYSPPEKSLVLELLKATQKILLRCSPCMTAGDPASLRALSTSHTNTLRSSPPAQCSQNFVKTQGHSTPFYLGLQLGQGIHSFRCPVKI